jgi:tRNA 2-thiouridine synthesizing protein C
VSKADRKKLLVVIRHTPYGSSLGRASLDVALAMAAFDQAVDVLFMGDGVLQLLAGQDGKAIGVKNIEKLLGSLPLYDIESVYVDAAGAERYGLDSTRPPGPVTLLGAPAIKALMADADHLLGF